MKTKNLLNQTLHLAFMAVTTFIVVGCAQVPSSSVNQSDVYTSYSANYDDTSKSLTATATFFVGGGTGTYVALDGGSSVYFNSTLLTSSTDLANQIDYENTWKNLFPSPAGSTYSFVYTDNNGKVYTNTISIPILPQVQYPSTTVCASTGIPVNWATTTPVGSDTLSFVLNRQDGSGGGSQEIYDLSSQATSGNYTIVATTFQELGAGSYQVQLCRGNNPQLQSAPAAGGGISATSCTAITTINVQNC